MKNIILISAIALTITGAISAKVFSNQNAITSISTFLQGDARIQIRPEELPAAIKKTLADDKYNQWEISAVFWVKSKTEYYEIMMKKEVENKIFKFNKEGKLIEEV